MTKRASRLGYQPTLDGIRGVALMAIIFFHAYELPSGASIGLDLFFVLSGFLITTLLLEEWVKRDAISLRAFYLRRFLRLFPAMFVLLVGYVLILALQSDLTGIRLKSAVVSLLYVSNFAQGFGFEFDAQSLGHLWSLGLEEQFYLIWPSTLVLVLVKWPRRIIHVAVAGIGAVILWRLWLIVDGAPFERLYFPPDVRFDEFLVGCLGGILFVRHRDVLTRISSRTYVALCAVAVVVLTTATLLLPPPEEENLLMQYGGYTVIPLLALVVILTCVLDRWALLRRFLSVEVFVFLGKVSYSVYLWHFVINFVTREVELFGSLRITRLFQIALSYAAGIGSYFLVERPFLRLKERFSKRPPQTPPAGPGRLPFEVEPGR
jgi:peptidoglycan/LPS O-acetylase OafA/YrhL